MAKRRRPSRGRSKKVDYSSSEQEVDFQEEYSYVLSDLKRFAVLAAAMLVTLVVLALVLG